MKRSVKSLILLGVLIALLGGYTLVNQLTQKSEVSEEEGSFALTGRGADELTALSWTNEGEQCRFEKSGDEWSNANDASFPTDSEAVQSLADKLLAMQANRKLTDVEKLEDYGFSDDSYTVTAEWSDGTSTQYILGDETPFGDGHYLRIEGEDGVIYTAQSSLSAIFAEGLIDLAVPEEIPVVENAAQLTVGTQLDLMYFKTSTTIDPDQHWYAANGGEPMDDDDVEELIDSIAALSWEELISTDAGEEELTEWQLNDEAATRVVLLGEDGERMELLVGSTDESGSYYARLGDSTMVYTLSADSIEPILYSDESELWNTGVFPLEYEEVQRFTCKLNGRTLEYLNETQDAEEEAEDGEEEAAEDPAQELWNRIRDLRASDHCDEDPAGESLITICVTNTNGVQAECSFYTYSVDSYQAVTDGGRNLLVSADEVDQLIRRLKQ